MFNHRKWPFFRCFSDTAVAFRERVQADLESGQLQVYPGTLDLLDEKNARNRRESLFYRLIDRPSLVPLSSLLALGRSASDHIIEYGLFRGCREEVDRFGIRIDVELSEEARRLFESDEPIFFVGNHPCIWGPDFWAVAASLERLCRHRRGLVMLTWSMVTALCPGLAPYSEPVAVTARGIERFTHDETGVSDNRLAASEKLFHSWSPDIPMVQSRKRTYAALEKLATRWVGNEHILIFPTGGAGTAALWFSGVGRILRFAAERLGEDTPTDPHVVFFRLQGASDFLMCRPPFLAPWHPARLLTLFRRQRIVVRYCETFRLRDHRESFLAMSNRELARHMQEQFDGAALRPNGGKGKRWFGSLWPARTLR